MSGIYIKGMEMPKSCASCYFKYVAFEGLVKCDLAGHDFKDYRETGYRDDCPLVPVPDHGDLIDRDALLATERETFEDYHIEEAPTIIPASKEDA